MREKIVTSISQTRAEFCTLFHEVVRHDIRVTIVSQKGQAALISFKEFKRLKRIEREWFNFTQTLSLLPGDDESDQV